MAEVELWSPQEAADCLGRSVTTLGKELGMSEKTVSERLRGKGAFNTDQLEKTATMLGMSLYQLMVKLLQPIDGIKQIKPSLEAGA